jgi:inorganic pyrophosphatase
LPPHWLREIEAFFATYKLLQDVETHVEGWGDSGEAWDVSKKYTVMSAEDDDLFHSYRPKN